MNVSKYTTQNLISIKLLFSVQYLMTISKEHGCQSLLLFLDNALKFFTTRHLKQQMS